MLFAPGSYVGETAVKTFGGKWLTDDGDPEGEVNIAVELPDGTVIFPVQRCMKRYQNGSEDAIYPYLYILQRRL